MTNSATYIGVTINPLSRRSGHKRKSFSLSIDDRPDQEIHFGLQPNQDDLVIEQLKSETVKLQFKGRQLWDRMCIFYETPRLEDIKQFESDAISHLLIYSDLAYPDATNANAIDSGYSKKASSYFAYALLGERFERHNAYLDKQRKFIEDLSQTASQIAVREVLMRSVLASDNSSGLIKLVEDMIQDKKLPSGSRLNLSLALQSMKDSLRSHGNESSSPNGHLTIPTACIYAYMMVLPTKLKPFCFRS